MPVLQEREYRIMPMWGANNNEGKKIESEYYVEGLATTFNDPYLMMDTGDFKVYEQIDRNALHGADMSDLKFQINHEGTVYARHKQGTLGYEVRNDELFIYADLSKTTSARERYEEIRAGYIDQMSWAFIVNNDEYKWNDDMTICTRTITKVKKVYEFSGVTEPANSNTSLEAKSMKENQVNNGEIHIINTRNLLNGVIESREQELLIRKKQEHKKKRFTFDTENLILIGGISNETK